MGGTIEGRTKGGHFDEVLIDHERALVLMDYLHWKIHVGELFFISDVTTGSTPIAYLVRTGLVETHIKFLVQSGLKVSAAIIEGVTTTAVGTAVAKQNYNRDSVKTVGTLVYKGPTYSGGTTFRTNQSGFGTVPGQASSGSSGSGIEYNLKPNADYVLLLTPSASTDVVVIADFYEET